MLRVALATYVVGLVMAGTGAGQAVADHDGVAEKQTVFRDARAESPSGPDISLVTVSSDDDELTVRVDVPTHPTLTEDMRIRIWLDADDDRSTGLAVEGREGFDHNLLVDRWELGYGAVGLFRCNGSTCSGGRADPSGSVRFEYDRAATFSIDARELGLRRLERVALSVVVTAGVRFDPAARAYDLTSAVLDTAPEQGALWRHDAQLLRVTSFSATPATPRAGNQQRMRLGVIRTDTGAAPARANVSCAARVGGRRMPVRTSRLVGRHAVCGFDIPEGTSGRRFRSTIAVTVAGAVVARSVSGTIG